jgi:ABC-type sugar transport system substrate-binding protein
MKIIYRRKIKIGKGEKVSLNKSTAIKTIAIMSALAFAVPTTTASAAPKFKLCVALGGIPGILGALGTTGDPIAKAGAKKRGWDYYEVSNKLDAPTAVKNADLIVQQKCSALIQFNGRPEVNPTIAKKLAKAKIPVITYDIAQPGWYFLGIDNLAAGKAGGAALGKLVKEKWNCQPDLVLESHGYGAGIVDAMRTGGMVEGLKSVCPDIDKSKFKPFEGNGEIAVSQPAARDILAANPTAKKIAVVGLNDAGVVGALLAARQLGSGYEAMGWGQDGNLIAGDKVDPDLKGSVLYFLEGYSAYAFEVLDAIAKKSAPKMRDGAVNPAVLVKPCPVSAAQAKGIPIDKVRIAQLAKDPSKTLYSIYCPK